MTRDGPDPSEPRAASQLRACFRRGVFIILLKIFFLLWFA
jgi:hypothetical protein